MDTLVVRCGPGLIQLAPGSDPEPQIESGDGDSPTCAWEGDQFVISAATRTCFRISLLPQSVTWRIAVPARFRRLLVQAAGVNIESTGLEWEQVRLDGANTRLHCTAEQIGQLELVGAGVNADVQVDQIETVRMDGIHQRVIVCHRTDFDVSGSTSGMACEIHAPSANAAATHRVRYCPQGLELRLEMNHA